ncbi:MAG: HDOD domain-containing protein [Syntrophales bacterium]
MVKVSHLKPEMVVCSDVKDRNGRLLVAADTRLTEKHIRIIRIWGVVEAEIEDISNVDGVPPSNDVIDPVIIRAAEETMRRRFRYNDLENSAISELFRISSQREASTRAQSGPEKNPLPEVCRLSGKGKNRNDTKRLVSPDERFEHIRKLIQKNVKLTTLPAIFARISEIIMKPSSSSHEIADLISKDTSLTARLLKIVNSAFYYYPSRIDSLSQAVSIVGTNQISMLALGIDVVDEFKNIPSGYITMDSFWRHSIACGIIARLIATTRNIQNTERLFVAGMLHDIGRLLVYHYTPQYALDIFEEARDTEKLLSQVEEAYLGVSHTEIGGLLFQIWKLPQSLENAVRYHHKPGNSQNSLEPAIVHVADVTAKALGIGSSGDQFVPTLDPAAWKQVGLSINALDPIVAQADRQLGETFRLFFK